MPEQLLDDAQVGTALEQVRRERVAERVRADLAAQAGALGGGGHGGPGLLAREPSTAVAEEQRPAAHRLDVVARDAARREDRPSQATQMVDRYLADRHEPLLVALADDPHEGAVERQVLAVEPDRLAHPQTRGVQQLEQCPIADAAGRCRLEQPFDLADVERVGQIAGSAAAGRDASRRRPSMSPSPKAKR